MSEQKRASFAVEDMKVGGGNLWGSAGPVRAKIIAGRFTKEAPDNYAATGNPIFGVVDFHLAAVTREEGQSDEDYEAARRVNQSYSLGAQAGDNFTISEDGDYLIPTSDDAQIVKDSKFGIFAAALQGEGVSKTVMQAFGFKKILNLDGDFKRIVDKARDFNDSNKKASKFPPSTLCLVKLYSLAGEVAKGAATVAKATTTTATPVAASGGDLDDDTWQYLEAVLKAKGGTEQRGRLTLAVSKAAGDNPNRQALARRASEESFISEMVKAGVITYAASEKGQPVSLAA